MDDRKREVEHYRAAAIAARAAADQFRVMAERGKPKSPGNVANVVMNAWIRALERARKADAGTACGDLDACTRKSAEFVAGLRDAASAPILVSPAMIQEGEGAMSACHAEFGYHVAAQVEQVYIAMERERRLQAVDAYEDQARRAGKTA